jgi:hypothetical protein
MIVEMRLAAAAIATLLFFHPASTQQGGVPGSPPPAFGGRGGGGGGPQSELQLVARFDVDDDGRLDASERAAARAWLAQQPRGGPGRGRMGGPPPAGARDGVPPGARAGGGPGFAGGGRGGRGMVPGTPGPRLAPAEVTSHEGTRLYDLGVIRTLFLEFPNEDWEDELSAFHNTDVEVPATLRVDGRSYEEVGVGFRGASSFGMVPAGSKRSFNVSLDFVHEDQALEGYRSLNLLNANNDPTFVRTVLYSQVARQYIAAPMVNYVRVVINGESWGIYVSAQQFNRDFLRDFFPSQEGARWKVPGSPGGRAGMEYLGEDVDAYRRLYEIKTKDDPARWADLVNLFRVLHETPVESLESALAEVLDVDGALRFLALDVALVNSDGYWTRASDYNLYQDPSGRFHVVPHDMNEALGAGGGRGGGARLDPLVGPTDASKPLRSRLLAVPALRERYLGYVRDIAEKWLDWQRVGPLVEQHQALIREDVMRDTRKLYPTDSFDSGALELRSFLEQRREYLLSSPRP